MSYLVLLVPLSLTSSNLLQERVNICRFWEPQSAVWLPLPLQWELHVDFVQAGVQRVMVRESSILSKYLVPNILPAESSHIFLPASSHNVFFSIFSHLSTSVFYYYLL